MAESRARELKLLQENEQLGATIHSLMGLLLQQGTPIPGDIYLPQLSPPANMLAGSSPSAWSDSTFVNSAASPPSRRHVCVADVDPTGLGVDFVLT